MTKFLPAVAALAVASALLVPTVSQAATADSVSVSYADLNLRGAAGRDTLNRRVNYAAEVVCSVGQAQILPEQVAAAECQEQALSRAKPAIAMAIRSAFNPNVTVGASALIISAQ
jgi:UrcA family protein